MRARLAPFLYAAPVIAAALAAAFYFTTNRADLTQQSGSVQVVGSETMRPVMAACAEEFMSRHPQADVIVKGGGSGDGIAAVLHGIADIGMTSRPLSAGERQFAATKAIDVSMGELALDGVTVIVNRANPIAALDFAQLRAIFTGSIVNWRELGGADMAIAPFGRSTGSGTASLFNERVLEGGAPGSSVRPLPTNEAIVAEVGAQPGAIGYVGFGALRGGSERIKAVPLRSDDKAAPVAPSVETIRSGSYPFARALYVAAPGKPAGTVKAFLDFCSGASGQVLIQRAGYVAIAPGPQ
jgi:phosphate transport system substrate-binding protein